MAEDQELDAMKAVFAALEPLDADARTRILHWVAQRFALASPGAGRPLMSPPTNAANGSRQAANVPGDFAEFHSLFDAAGPTTDVDRALVGGYWFQISQAQQDFSGQQVNDELKQLGHPIGNITRAFDNLQAQKPVLARQVQKTGKNKQGRKRYKLTQEGISRVASLLAGLGNE